MKVQPGRIRPFIFYDVTGSGNPIAKYQCVSLATTSQVTTANAAGIRGGFGDIVVTCPVTSSLATDKVLGITAASAKNGSEIGVVLDGSYMVMVNAAITVTPGKLLSPIAAATRTNAQAPFLYNQEMLLPFDPSMTVTYNVQGVDDTALPAAGTTFYPVGTPIQDLASMAQYDLLAVEINTTIITV